MDVDADMKRSDDERGPSKPRGERDRRDSVRERERDRERDRERRDRSRASSPVGLVFRRWLTYLQHDAGVTIGTATTEETTCAFSLNFSRPTDFVSGGCSGARHVVGTGRGPVLILVLTDAPLRRVDDAGVVEEAVRVRAHLRVVGVLGLAADATRPSPGRWEGP